MNKQLLKCFLGLLFFMQLSMAQQDVEVTFMLENHASIETYLEAQQVSFFEGELATLKGFENFVAFSKVGKLAVPEAYFFNAQGELIKNRNKGVSCGATIKKLAKVAHMKTDPTQTLEDFLKDVHILDQRTFMEDGTTLYVVINWAKFLSEQSEVSFNWFNSLHHSDTLKVKVLLLNLDLQEAWNMTQDQKDFLGVL
ncbi:hypothetical protein SAMN05216480_12112 [Pustulibacterium marinum]|uniref:Uncharacterized protein n=1 Tax=Pustulibacterium marinum TaxID=1224947 RepID=A0A1I7ISS1_9FLAO|nr:hypothetical protein [Pustulibacterium marinum]SFU75911.1 hypothetical protein SAMN05216480_12112 [Pustulibacterium marinum]